MRIAFYAPLKAPDHPVPSGDRLMARLLLAALRMGHRVDVVSTLRPFLREAWASALAGFRAEAAAERDRIAEDWKRAGAPDLWFCYHPYYKAPDLLGPALCAAEGIPYVTAECSWSPRRNIGDWAEAQAEVLAGVQQAALNLCLTERDRAGLAAIAPGARLDRLPPFIDTAAFRPIVPRPEPFHLVTVAMMRPGDKLSSYRALAGALAGLADLPWRLSVLGDGAARAEVEAAFAALPPGQVNFLGQGDAATVRDLLARGTLYVWPGHAEGYGLAYLEAQAAGLPVVAERVAGVPEVVEHDRTGLLTPPGDTGAYAGAIRALLLDDARRAAMADAARSFVLGERSLDRAAAQLSFLLEGL